MSKEPKHYFRNDVSVNDILDLVFTFYGKDLTPKEGWLLGNVIKYLMRCKFKGDLLSDLDKADEYFVWLKKELIYEKEEDTEEKESTVFKDYWAACQTRNEDDRSA